MNSEILTKGKSPMYLAAYIGYSMEEPEEQCTVVFALIVKGTASE
jgi:hypothetical protein